MVPCTAFGSEAPQAASLCARQDLCPPPHRNQSGQRLGRLQSSGVQTLVAAPLSLGLTHMTVSPCRQPVSACGRSRRRYRSCGGRVAFSAGSPIARTCTPEPSQTKAELIKPKLQSRRCTPRRPSASARLSRAICQHPMHVERQVGHQPIVVGRQVEAGQLGDLAEAVRDRLAVDTESL